MQPPTEGAYDAYLGVLTVVVFQVKTRLTMFICFKLAHPRQVLSGFHPANSTPTALDLVLSVIGRPPARLAIRRTSQQTSA